ncbi:MAG: ATP-binding protein, partial [Fibrobacteraceae bacterium]|nr:ATP-binding protein [Fibrobacteraceae bacterium]
MHRKIIENLIQWKNSPRRKPLILWGARQVGKTWVMQEFGKRHFSNAVYISFYNNKRIAGIFNQDYDPRRILNALEIELKQKIEPQKTLLIFDEIQAAPKVVESLKYFCEQAQEYAVIAAGSLLGVAIHEGISFPVGKVDELRLYPMDFEEFLRALDEDKLADYKQNPSSDEANSFNEKYRQLLREYYFVGGMPEVVDAYRQHHDFEETRKIQNNILSQYEGDFGKHIEPRLLPRVRMVWDALPMQLAKENKKFFFGQIKKGARMKDFEVAIQWLCDSGVVHKVHKVSKPGFPLKAYTDFDAFKIYMLDVGLLAAKSELDENSIVHGNEIFTEFKGALTEQYVLQELKASSKITPFYYSSEKSSYEVDFVIQKGNNVIPIEVKAEENLKAKSLKYYCEKFKPVTAIRTSMSNYRKEE